MKNAVPLAWVSFLSPPKGEQLVPRLTISVTSSGVTFMRVMQWMVVIVVVGSLAFAIRCWNDSVLMDETATHLDSVVQRLNQANAHLSEGMVREHLTLSPEQFTAIKQDVVFVNQLTEKRAFSWSRLLADLETPLPPRMALHTVRLNFQDSTVALHGSAASLQDVQTFVRQLEQHAAFQHAALVSHHLEHSETQRAYSSQPIEAEQSRSHGVRGVDFQLTVVYRPSF